MEAVPKQKGAVAYIDSENTTGTTLRETSTVSVSSSHTSAAEEGPAKAEHSKLQNPQSPTGRIDCKYAPLEDLVIEDTETKPEERTFTSEDIEKLKAEIEAAHEQERKTLELQIKLVEERQDLLMAIQKEKDEVVLRKLRRQRDKLTPNMPATKTRLLGAA